MEQKYKAVGFSPNASEPVGHAAGKLAEHFGLPLVRGEREPHSIWVDVSGEPAGVGRAFAIRREGDNLVFSGDCPRTVLAGALYYIHHAQLGHPPEPPIERTSPFANRLIMEDMAFMCYWPRGFDFDPKIYAENLAALGFTAMEVNRFSRDEPMEPYHWAYRFSNTSPSAYVWTPWHEGVWEKELVEANAAELRSSIDVSVKFGLTPTVTTFLPRPYPESFFERHPGMRGEKFFNGHMEKTGHPPLYRLDTDKQEVQDFYEMLYRGLFDQYPEIGYLFFFHGDLGSGFSKDRAGGSGAVHRMAGFHRMLQSLLKEKGIDAKVWVNPWHLDERELGELDLLPREVGFSIKDNVGIQIMAGTTPLILPDATIITAEVGSAAKTVFGLAEPAGRQVCMAQYQDLSEDLDPVLAVPHPIMTFRKLGKALETSPEYTSVNWGILSPEVIKTNLNQNVIREFCWGERTAEFDGMAAALIPASFTEEQRASVLDAWSRVDKALTRWPQFWGLRLEDSGMRLRWLTKPFGFDEETDTAEVFAFWLDRQIYRYTDADPLNAFMEMTPAQAVEVSGLYAEMVALIAEAREALSKAKPSPGSACDWLDAQADSLRTLELFWTTYVNLLGYWGERLSSTPPCGTAGAGCSAYVASEIENVSATIDHLSAHPETIFVAQKGAWGQCFGPDYLDEFSRKLEFMKDSPSAPKHRHT